jgi:hypothetical protein
MDTKSAEQASLGESDNTIAAVSDLADDSAASSKKKKTTGTGRPQVSARKTSKTGQARQSVRGAAKEDKLVCRYCGSDDLAPSFKKRRDARCRACFKKRYGASGRSKKPSRSRKSKAAG